MRVPEYLQDEFFGLQTTVDVAGLPIDRAANEYFEALGFSQDKLEEQHLVKLRIGTCRATSECSESP